MTIGEKIAAWYYKVGTGQLKRTDMGNLYSVNLADAINNAIDDQWIDVKDRLPEPRDLGHGCLDTMPVVIYCPEHGEPQGAFYDENGFCNDESLEYRGVTHWKPLSKGVPNAE